MTSRITDTWEERQDGTRVITVRMPSELHKQLKSLAHRCECSVNELCVSTLNELAARGMVFEAAYRAAVAERMEGVA